MQDYFNDFDIWTEALKSIDMNESALPIYHGHLLIENQDVYMKMQKLTNCPRMIKCHSFIFNLDPENLTETEISEVNKLYDVAVNRGLIDDTIGKDKIENIPVNNYVEEPVEKPESCLGKSCKYEVMYSACDNNGNLKTGIAYSNSDSQDKAIQEVYNNLSKFNYHNISILGIECKEDTISFNNQYDQNDDMMNKCKSDYLNSMTLPVYEEEEEDEEEEKPADDSEDDDSGEESEEEEKPADDSGEEAEDESEEEADEEEADEEAEESADEETEEDETNGEEDSEEPEDSEESELTDEKKLQYKNAYIKAFKDSMETCEFFEKSYRMLTVDEKKMVLSEVDKSKDAWKDLPTEKFMTETEEIQLYNIITPKKEDTPSSEDDTSSEDDDNELKADVDKAGEESEDEESDGEESEDEESEDEEPEDEESEDEESENESKSVNESQIIEAYLI